MKPSDRSIEELLWRSIQSLEDWLDDNGWAGYDPYDIRGTGLYLRLIQQGADAPTLVRALRKILIYFEGRHPLWTRRFLGVKKQRNPKGMGLFARGYLDLYQATGEERYKDKALQCLDWLGENPSPGYAGFCWGYPFDWQARVFIPQGTPSAVVSSVVGDAFWRAYQVLGDQRYLEICDSICQFFLSDLNRDELEDGAVCFSYTPVDDFHVHNANLFAAEFLIRVGSKLDDKEYLAWGRRAAAYALREQNPDGSLYYWGKVQNHYSPDHIDHYHSGFEIRALYQIWKSTEDPQYLEAVKRYYRFYRENLISLKDGSALPKMNPGALYPIDIHSCSEALLCSAALAEDFEEARDLLPALTAWTLSNMQTEAGWFIYRIQKGRSSERRIEIPYIRWGQAWMLRALAFYYQMLTSE